MKVSIVMPVLDEQERVAAAVGRALEQQPWEVLVVDGGSRDATASLVPAPARLLRAPRGRAHQVNAGAAAATGDALLVLHADCLLPPCAVSLVAGALADPTVAGGAFHKRFDSPSWLLRRGVRVRTRAWHALGAVFGDQAMFVRRGDFERIGGCRTDVPAEDLDLARRLRRIGRLALLPQEVVVSARRLHAQGILRTWAGWWLVALRQVLRGPWNGLNSGAG